MKYLVFKIRRNFWTAFCKISAKLAVKLPKFSIFLNCLDYSLKKRSVALSDEATYCLIVINKWQGRAKKCVLAHHENEKVVKSDEEKK